MRSVFRIVIMPKWTSVLTHAGAVTVALAAVLVALLSLPAFGQNPDQRIPLQQFVAQTFVHGVPFEQVLAYGPA